MHTNDTLFKLNLLSLGRLGTESPLFPFRKMSHVCVFLDTFCPPSSISRDAKIRGRGNVKHLSHRKKIVIDTNYVSLERVYREYMERVGESCTITKIHHLFS